MPTTISHLRAFRESTNTIRDQPVKLSRYITVDYTPLTEVPDIRLQFIVGGGWNLHFDYTIIGGPDDGKRVTLLPWKPRWVLAGIPRFYNGTAEEAEAELGHSARPAIQAYSSALHITTIMYLKGVLVEERESALAREYARLYEDLPDSPEGS